MCVSVSVCACKRVCVSVSVCACKRVCVYVCKSTNVIKELCTLSLIPWLFYRLTHTPIEVSQLLPPSCQSIGIQVCVCLNT